MTPAVSILMPARDCAETLPTAVASVLAQTVGDWELLIVENPGACQASSVLRGFRDERIRLLESESRGRSCARQTGLEAACGEFIAFLDADDWMYPHRLETQIEALQADPDLALVGAGMIVEDLDGTPAGKRRMPSGAGKAIGGAGRLLDSPVLNAATMIRRELTTGLGYDVSFERGEDTDFLLRYLENRRYRLDHEPLYVYREFLSFSAAELRIGLRNMRTRHLRRAGSPLRRCEALCRWMAKKLAYEMLLATRGEEFIVRRRCEPLSAEEGEAFRAARRTVETCLAGLTRAESA